MAKRAFQRSLGARVALFIVLAATARAEEPKGWPPIPPEDLALKDNPAEPGASAMILLKTDFRDDEKKVREVFYRIKIFTESGRRHGDIEIPYSKGAVEVENLEARVVQPDGRVNEFYGPVYEKIVAQTRKRRVMAKTMALPEVQPGSIIDYRYRIKLKGDNWFGVTWVVQESRFLREAQLIYRSPRSGYQPQRLVPRMLNQNPAMNFDKDGNIRITLRDLPAFEEEPFMPPEGAIKSHIQVVYPAHLFDHLQIEESKKVNDFIGSPKRLTSEVQKLLAGETDPRMKLRKLYMAVQERIRNLSYEESYTKKERKTEGLNERKSAMHVWRYGYGLDFEINRLFAALCRAAGFQSDVVAVAPRDDSWFESEIPLILQATAEVVVVDIPGEVLYFDPGTRFTPFGQLSWENQEVRGIRFGQKVRLEVNTPHSRPEENSTQNVAEMQLRPDGTGTVKLTQRYQGQAAVFLRNEMFDLVQEQRERKLREGLEVWLPTAEIKEIRWDGLDSAADVAELSYTFELPDCAYRQGTRLFVRKSLGEYSSPFSRWKRIHPVYLRYATSVENELRILPPDGFVLENRTEPVLIRGIGYDYEGKIQTEDDSTIVHRSRSTGELGLLLGEDQYLAVKRYFDRVAAEHHSHIVLREQ